MDEYRREIEKEKMKNKRLEELIKKILFTFFVTILIGSASSMSLIAKISTIGIISGIVIMSEVLYPMSKPDKLKDDFFEEDFFEEVYMSSSDEDGISRNY